MILLDRASLISLVVISSLILMLIVAWIRMIKFVDSQSVIEPRYSLFVFESIVAPIAFYFGFPVLFVSCGQLIKSTPFSICFSVVGVVIAVVFVTMFFCRSLFQKKQKVISRFDLIKIVTFEFVLFVFVFSVVVVKCKSWVLMVNEHSVGMYFISASFYLSVAFSMFVLVVLNLLSVLKWSLNDMASCGVK